MPKAPSHGKILVIDDHYGVVSDDFYSQEDFSHDFNKLPFTFAFSAAWDEDRRQYTAAAALQAVDAEQPDAVLLDMVFDQRASAGQLGLAILGELSARYPSLPVVVMTVLTRDESWQQCARLGAVDYLRKPLDGRLLWQTMDRYVGVAPGYWLIGQNSLFLEALNLTATAAEGGETPVMITGESGTGKELLARYLHRHGRRSAQPFEIIYLPNIPGDMQAANLFGYRRGAFTGADRDEAGRFVAADGGVVFLDEIGDIDADTQLRLLRVAESGEITRLGDGRQQQVNVQLVTATNADLAAKIKAQEFRYDLWARLNGMPAALPALAQRKDDILLLLQHLLRCQALSRKRPMPTIPPALEERLRNFAWPGNIRGLRSYAQRVFDLAGEHSPDETAFIKALPVSDSHGARRVSLVPPHSHSADDNDTIPDASASDHQPQDMAQRLQQLRLEELALLAEALDKTRDPVTGAPNRAKAAAMLKGKAKCSTNEFDRWAQGLWQALNPQSRDHAAQRFPELLPALKLKQHKG